MPPTGSDSIRHGQGPAGPAGPSNVKIDFHCCSVILTFVSTIANYYAHFLLLMLTLYLFPKVYNTPLFTILLSWFTQHVFSVCEEAFSRIRETFRPEVLRSLGSMVLLFISLVFPIVNFLGWIVLQFSNGTIQVIALLLAVSATCVRLGKVVCNGSPVLVPPSVLVPCREPKQW